MKITVALALTLTLAAGVAQAQTITDTAVAVNSSGQFAGEFDTVIQALICTGLAGELAGRKQYTVFAPTDGAFAALGLDETNICTTFSNAVLKNILLYHVSPGRRLASDVLEGSNVRMLNKSFTYPFLDNNAAYLRDNSDLTADAEIIVTDVTASNGVIHVIDQVLLP
ncbi:MAG TPA: fasciclin domain-containing protein [Thermoanaerobaculia bacterium]